MISCHTDWFVFKMFLKITLMEELSQKTMRSEALAGCNALTHLLASVLCHSIFAQQCAAVYVRHFRTVTRPHWNLIWVALKNNVDSRGEIHMN